MLGRVIAFGSLALGLFGACASGPQQVEPADRGGRGESCQARNDCEGGLACLNGVCRQNDFPIAPLAKHCDIVSCTNDADCCEAYLSSQCATFEAQCTAGDQISCDSFAAQCDCPFACAADGQCENSRTCTIDTDCPGFAPSCVGGQCQECVSTPDCVSTRGPDYVCSSGVCTQGCTSNEECALLQNCNAGTCVDRDCASDRECIGFTGDMRAVCASGECTVACDNDGECGGTFQVCEGGECIFIGCENDEECRHLYHNQLLPGDRAVCRE